MTKFDRYFFNQLIVSFLFFSMVLISVFWVNKAVLLFDKLISAGHSALIFVEFSVLMLPDAVAMVFPISSFAAAVYVTNRLSNESELIIMRVSGLSSSRLARPVAFFGLIVAAVMLTITNFAIPYSQKQLNLREHQIGANLSAKLLREGQFIHPMQNATIFIESITSDGELENIFLSDRRDPDVTRTYSAKTAYLLLQEKGAKLVMLNGITQIHNVISNNLSTTTFTDLAFDVGEYFTQQNQPKPTISEFNTWEMIANPQKVVLQTTGPLGHFVENLHQRFQQPLLCLLSALIGFGAIAGAGYSRVGTARHIIFAIFLLVTIKLLESSLKDLLYQNAANWILVYVPSLFALICFLLLICSADRIFLAKMFLQKNSETFFSSSSS